MILHKSFVCLDCSLRDYPHSPLSPFIPDAGHAVIGFSDQISQQGKDFSMGLIVPEKSTKQIAMEFLIFMYARNKSLSRGKLQIKTLQQVMRLLQQDEYAIV